MPATSQQVRRRAQQPVTYQANQTQMVPLGRGMIYRDIVLRLTGAPTLTAANNTIANTLRGDEWGVVKQIQIVANGSDVLRQFTGDQLWWLNFFAFQTAPRVTPTIGDATTANPAFDSTLRIPFMMFGDVYKAMDTALDSSLLTDLSLRITWGTFTDINSAATAWTTNPAIEVSSLESFFPAVGAGQANPTMAQCRINNVVATPAAASTGFQVQQTLTYMYRGFLINTSNTANTADTAGLITNVKLKSGPNTFVDVPAITLREIGYSTAKVNRQYPSPTGATGVYVNPRRSGSSNQDCWFWLDLVTDWYMTEAIDTLGLSEFLVEFVTTAAATINIIPIQVIPVRG